MAPAPDARSSPDAGAADRTTVVLVGPPGAGKSTVAQLLSSRWDVPWCDTDDLVVARAGKPIADIFVDAGEAAFRALEQEAVAEALSAQCPVVSLGGGAILSTVTRERLVGHVVVFLDVGLAAAASRVGLGVARPLLLGNVRSQLKALLDARRPLYEEVASFTVATDTLSGEDVAAEIERRLRV